MKYFKFNLQESNRPEKFSVAKRLFIKVISFFIPKANPDFEDKYSSVVCWYIEYDDINNYTNREIGFDENKNIIVKGPINKNLGFWTDTDLVLKDYFDKWNLEYVTSEEFNSLWQKGLTS